jgi:hypothetical protein
MALVKNKTTPENRAFWEHVEKIAQRVRTSPEFQNFRCSEPSIEDQVALEGRRDLCGGEPEQLEVGAFYIDDAPNGERFFISGDLVSRQVFLHRRETECPHRFQKYPTSPESRHCIDCGMENLSLEIPDEIADAIYINMCQRDIEFHVQRWKGLSLVCVRHG